jgi:predicted Zn-dependent peptidase
MKKNILLVFLLILTVSTAVAADFSSKIKSFTLENGMRFYVVQRHHSPTFAGMIKVNVGSADEGSGQTGLAHLFEHLAFKGTPVIGTREFKKETQILEQIREVGRALANRHRNGEPETSPKTTELRARLNQLQLRHQQYINSNETAQIYAQNGAVSLNATTGRDTTEFYVKLPANRLELWFLMESERFKHPVLREFYKEKAVAIQEHRMNIENDPDGRLLNEFFHVFFIRHPYRHPTTGYIEDLRGYTEENVSKFLKTYYIPNNMAAAIVGDVKLETVKQLAEQYFGDIPPGKIPPRPAAFQSKQEGERRFELEYGAQPGVIIGYHVPAFPDKENVVLKLIISILLKGESSRMYNDLVYRKKMAIELISGLNFPGSRYPNLFMIHGRTRFPHTPEDLEKAIYPHLEKLKKEPVTPEELKKVINQYEVSFYKKLEDNMSIAGIILNSVLLYNDVESEFKKVQRMKAITPGEIIQTAKKIFNKSNRTVGILRKLDVKGSL